MPSYVDSHNFDFIFFIPWLYCRMVGYVMNWKGFGRLRWSAVKYYPGNCPEEMRKAKKTSVSTSGVPGEIRMRYFLCTSWKCYCPSRSARSVKQGRAAATNTFDVDTIFLTINTMLRQPRRLVPEEGGGQKTTRITIKRPHVKAAATESAVSFNINQTWTKLCGMWLPNPSLKTKKAQNHISEMVYHL